MSEENKTKWVEFVGGPLHGQCRNIPYDATEWNAYPQIPAHYKDYDEEIDLAKPVCYVTYKIERFWENKPDTTGFREWFKGILK